MTGSEYTFMKLYVAKKNADYIQNVNFVQEKNIKFINPLFYG